MAEPLIKFKESVQHCNFSFPRSADTLRHFIHKIAHHVQRCYRHGNDPMVLYDILKRFQQAEKHLQVLQSFNLDTNGGEHYKRAFNNAKSDTLYLISLVQSAIQFGHLVPAALKQKV
jgi:hypothetical protein